MTPYGLFIEEEALLEVQDSMLWYEKSRGGLGVEFRKEVDAQIRKILINPYHYPVLYRNVHEVSIKRFPFIIS